MMNIEDFCLKFQSGAWGFFLPGFLLILVQCSFWYPSKPPLLLTYVLFKTGNDEKGLILVETPEDVGSQDNDLVSTTVEQSSENFLDANAEPFIPTKEWQIVKEGQSVPAGLHIRMNFQTHLKEAKLMDGDDGARFQKKLKHNDQLSKGIYQNQRL